MSRSLATLLVALAALSLGASGRADPKEVGLAVGETAPAFTLTDQHGTPRSLASLLGRGKLALVFFRSADW